MKLVRFGCVGNEKPGLLDARGRILDVSHLVSDFNPHTLQKGVLEELAGINLSDLPLIDEGTRLGPPVGGIRKVVCVGLNYRDHAKESGMPLPKEPILFMKAATAICGPNDPVRLPAGCEKGDWEVELGIVMAKNASGITAEMADAHIAGYCVVNDLSERHYQLECEGQWVKGKSLDSFGPMGPFVATKDEIEDVHNLPIWLELNDEKMQNSNTRQMEFGVPALISYISRFMTLEAGDLILSGTPPGVGLGLDPPRWLREGDRMRLGIEGLGVQEQQVVLV